ncbi:hypothetical protein CEUSTIGMA_g7248.t1 [Chlamydomonas eustigma]|uniref:Uncharacterized protein n=1 Tax=Chlamydomonas eustigma TaxID=1157962 RepID=A0A250X9Q9_9CHLO|nr:hypothetical protein CEUSTIGMA_g7248.t1 [Chlamydomonas eustigma]|eukprot:GAX79808.1 hypothetical protein CEUSTIGMA_g7248.t1 [Chlamydomonas eustigma]
MPTGRTRSSLIFIRIFIIVSILLISLGLFLPTVLQFLLDQGIRDSIIWRPDSPQDVDARFRGSADPSSGAQDFVKVWLFNITNVEGIRAGQKPILQQVGPFTYRKMKLKVDTWWDHTGKVTFKEYDYHLPVPELTMADLNSNIVTLNLPLIGVVENIRLSFSQAYQQWWLDLLVKAMAAWQDGHANGVFMTRTAGEIIWGYEDILLKRLASILPKGTIKSTLVQLLHNMSRPEEAIALQPSVFETGMNDIQRGWNTVLDAGFSSVTSWNNCTEYVHGSDGTQFHPGVKRDEALPIWVPQLYRTMPLVYVQDVEWLGVQFLRFWMDPKTYEPDDCHFQTIKGLLNITSPKAVGYNGAAGSSTGPPILVSPSHFCLCDEVLSQEVEGLSCNISAHTTYVDVEPISGIPMRGSIRTMISSQITDASRIHLEPQMAKNSNKSVVMPIFWMEENVQGLPEDVQRFKDIVYRVLWLKSFSSRWLPVIGIALLVALVITLVTQRSFQKEELDQMSLPSRVESSGVGSICSGVHSGNRGNISRTNMISEPLLNSGPDEV